MTLVYRVTLDDRHVYVESIPELLTLFEIEAPFARVVRVAAFTVSPRYYFRIGD